MFKSKYSTEENMKAIQYIFPVILVVFILGFLLLEPSIRGDQNKVFAAQEQDTIQGPFVSSLVSPGLSPHVRGLPIEAAGPLDPPTNLPRRNPLLSEADMGQRGTWNRDKVPVDPLIRLGEDSQPFTPGLDLSFDATSNPVACGGCTPPDPNGDVGPNH